MDLLLLSWGASAIPPFLAECTGRRSAEVRLGVIDDASIPFGDNGFVIHERERLTDFGYRVSTLRARDATGPKQFGEALDALDAVYVCAGETFVLLDSLQRGGLREVLADRVRAGLAYIGLSAGAVIAGPSAEPVRLMDDPTLAPDLTDYRGLGLIDSVPIPHADGLIPTYPPETFTQIRRDYGNRFPLTFINDDQALRVSGISATLVPSP
ncbi:MAG: Type 1 glutamine amidotransferase-like domain-containing protein [Gordonia sp. (in: high G+C Gram-positive bacteria)]|uniref:Type 1 glutamine amidotransferase-like domain-containing protein n=1 Tax=Gordonia sp. (in: high G+C Gram-positive bacteria) TaxID=84139 RepID=UPI003BB78E1E